ncbi:MAG: oxygen-independent coproporphyrinogen III oxidase [Gammaproteobacteria bacterium]|nr:MAG: oxygen-independent coproporphyrinogen III oxidase [Gammaproteobacteria bacterium]
MQPIDTARRLLAEGLPRQRLPRYTSYPPATAFEPLEADEAAVWLEALEPGRPVSLYVHVPFCRQLCWFCGCHTTITHKDDRLRAYRARLERELALIEARTGPLTFGHLHFGGGSPTALPADEFTAFMNALHGRHRFTETAEKAVEIDPRTADPARLDALAAAGINRVSLGVQDFDPRVQQAVNRIQPFERVAAVVDGLRRRGIGSINIDLMYGLPHQDEAVVAASARLALQLDPDRVALFGYAHLPALRKHQRLLDGLPMAPPDARARLFAAAAEVFREAGYLPVGIDHFVHPRDSMARALAERRLRRNFQGYTTDPCDTLIGLGASAIGEWPAGYLQNDPDLKGYARRVDAAVLPVVRGRALDAEDRRRRRLIGELMCYFETDLAPRPGEPAAALEAERRALALFAEAGLLRLEGERIVLTESGRPWVRAVCAVFDQGHHRLGRYSLAV